MHVTNSNLIKNQFCFKCQELHRKAQSKTQYVPIYTLYISHYHPAHLNCIPVSIITPIRWVPNLLTGTSIIQKGPQLQPQQPLNLPHCFRTTNTNSPTDPLHWHGIGNCYTQKNTIPWNCHEIGYWAGMAMFSRWHNFDHCFLVHLSQTATQIANFMGPTWGPSGANRTQVGPMLAPWTLLSGKVP